MEKQLRNIQSFTHLSIISLLFFCSPSTNAQDKIFTPGPYLIYDCQEKHWVCVDKTRFLECRSERDNKSKGPYHLCAPIESLPSKESCNQRQLFLTSQNHGQRFCIKDEWKGKNIKY